MILSQKQKTFCEIFSAFSKSSLNFDHCQKKGDPHSLFIFAIAISEKRGEINV